MTPSQRTGRTLLLLVALGVALVFGASAVFFVVGVFSQQPINLLDVLQVGVMVFTVLTVPPFVVRGLRRGDPKSRWALFAVLLASTGFYLFLGGMMAAPLPDPAEQAKWEIDFWWITPLTFAWSGICLVSAVLLALPPVGEYLAFRRSQTPDPAERLHAPV